MMNSIFLKVIILVYGRIYQSMIDLGQTSDLARFSALAQSALLLTLNVLSLIFVLRSIFELEVPSWTRFESDFWLILKIGTPLTAVAFVVLLKIITMGFGEHKDRLKDLQVRDSIRITAIMYPYLTMCLFIVSIALFAVL